MDLTWMENWLIWGWAVEIWSWRYKKKVVLSTGLSEETVLFRGKAEICKNKKGLKHYKREIESITINWWKCLNCPHVQPSTSSKIKSIFFTDWGVGDHRKQWLKCASPCQQYKILKVCLYFVFYKFSLLLLVNQICKNPLNRHDICYGKLKHENSNSRSIVLNTVHCSFWGNTMQDRHLDVKVLGYVEYCLYS